MRVHPYIVRRPVSYDNIIKDLTSSRFFVVNRPGPTAFIIKDGNSNDDVLFKITIGTLQTCTCGGIIAKKNLVCIHIAFVMTKVLRVPYSNPLSWQLSLTDIELTDILSGRHLIRSRRVIKQTACDLISYQKEIISDKTGISSRERKCLDDDRSCAVCQEDMTDEELNKRELCFCRGGCASNFHINCMIMVKTYAEANNKALLCPLCREEFGLIIASETTTPCKAVCEEQRFLNHPRKEVHSTFYARCSSCRTKITGNSAVYRCISCDNHDNCKRCFESTKSLRHSFVFATCSEYPNWKWSVAVYSQPKSSHSSRLSHLQHRELSTRDYTILLSLDENVRPVLHVYLANALTTVDAEHGTCSICDKRIVKESCTVKQLPCLSHIAHESCAVSMFMEIIRAGKIIQWHCPICNIEIYPCLRRPLFSNITTPNSNGKKSNLPLNQHFQKEILLVKGIIGSKISSGNALHLRAKELRGNNVNDKITEADNDSKDCFRLRSTETSAINLTVNGLERHKNKSEVNNFVTRRTISNRIIGNRNKVLRSLQKTKSVTLEKNDDTMIAHGLSLSKCIIPLRR